MKKSMIFMLNKTLVSACSVFACLFLVGVSLKAQTAEAKTSWQPPPGDLTLNVWPNAAPGAQPNPPPETLIYYGEVPAIGGRPIYAYANVSTPTLTLFKPKAGSTGAAVVVFPGGAYTHVVVDLEGIEVCNWLNSIGVTCILLKYRVPHTGPYPESAAALQDAQRTLGIVRSRAHDWHFDPQRIGVMGFSAGAHLVAALSTHFDQRLYNPIDDADQFSCRPDFAAIVYPAFMTLPDKNFILSPDLPVTPRAPLTFIVQAENDKAHVENSIEYFLALKNAKVSAEMHIYAEGGHGYGLRPTALPVTTWPRRFETWLQTIHILSPAAPGAASAAAHNGVL